MITRDSNSQEARVLLTEAMLSSNEAGLKSEGCREFKLIPDVVDVEVGGAAGAANSTVGDWLDWTRENNHAMSRRAMMAMLIFDTLRDHLSVELQEEFAEEVSADSTMLDILRGNFPHGLPHSLKQSGHDKEALKDLAAASFVTPREF